MNTPPEPTHDALPSLQVNCSTCTHFNPTEHGMGLCDYPLPKRMPLGVTLVSQSRQQHRLNTSCTAYESEDS